MARRKTAGYIVIEERTAPDLEPDTYTWTDLYPTRAAAKRAVLAEINRRLVEDFDPDHQDAEEQKPVTMRELKWTHNERRESVEPEWAEDRFTVVPMFWAP